MPTCDIVSYPGLVPYADALAMQTDIARRRLTGDAPDTLLLLEHPPTITLGRRARPGDLLTLPDELAARGIAVAAVDRGGEITYHAPGQLVAYPILDLRNYGQDLHRYLRDLEETVIRTLTTWDISGERIPGLTGVWVGGSKIAALGIQVSRWITRHGLALNVNPDLSPMRHDIVPCGIRDRAVTSLAELRPELALTRRAAEPPLIAAFAEVFGWDAHFRREEVYSIP